MVRPVIVPATRQLSEAHYSTLPGDTEARLNPGVRLADGELEIVDEIGRGGIAVVYRAIDHTSGKEVALKIGTADADGQRTPKRFRKEHRIGVMLGEHEQIVRPLRVGVLNAPAGFEGRMYLATELVEGKPLDIVMAVHRHGLDVRRACALGRDVGQALVAMHDQGIVHRDIKPGNVLVSGDNQQRARVIDFGLAYVRGDEWVEPPQGQTREANVSGTALYMAPEQALGHCPAPPADIYAFGAMLYEMFSGNPPHDRLPHAELLARKCDRTRSPISIGRMCADLDPRLVKVIDRCLVYEPSERPTASELVAVFDELLILAPARPEERGSAEGHRGIVVLLSVISVVAVAAVVLLLLAWPNEHPRVAKVPVLPLSPEQLAVVPSSGAPPVSSASGSARGGADTEKAQAPVPVVVPEHAVEPSESLAPSSETSSTDERSPRVPGRKGSQRVRPVSSNKKVDECSSTVSKAKRAAIQHQWGRVLRMTGSKECWAGDAASQRALLRTQAYFETGRYSDCIRAGRGLSDPQAVRWVRVCEAKSKG